MTTKKLAYPPRKNKKTNPLIYGFYVAIFLGFLYAIISLHHTDNNHPTIVLTEPVDLKNTPPVEMPTTTDTAKTTQQATEQTTQGTTQSTAQNTAPNSRVVWEMSQADPTKRPTNTQGLPPPTDPVLLGTAPSDTLAQDTPIQSKTPLSNQMGNQAILHPDDVPAIEHSVLPHLSTKAKPPAPQDTQDNDNGETNTQKLNAKLKEKETDILKEVKESLNRQDSTHQGTLGDLGKADTPDTSDDLDGVGN